MVGAASDTDRIKAERGPRRTIVQRWVRDAHNRLRYGAGAPRSDETLWVDPQQVTLQYVTYGNKGGPYLGPFHSGCVIGGDWDINTRLITSTLKYKVCVARFVHNKSWEETGIFENLLGRISKSGTFDDCRTEAELRIRYKNIDKMYARLKVSRQMKAKADMKSATRGEYGGIFAHINRHGKLIRIITVIIGLRSPIFSN